VKANDAKCPILEVVQKAVSVSSSEMLPKSVQSLFDDFASNNRASPLRGCRLSWTIHYVAGWEESTFSMSNVALFIW
jgi:hypothetical protein